MVLVAADLEEMVGWGWEAAGWGAPVAADWEATVDWDWEAVAWVAPVVVDWEAMEGWGLEAEVARGWEAVAEEDLVDTAGLDWVEEEAGLAARVMVV